MAVARHQAAHGVDDVAVHGGGAGARAGEPGGQQRLLPRVVTIEGRALVTLAGPQLDGTIGGLHGSAQQIRVALEQRVDQAVGQVHHGQVGQAGDLHGEVVRHGAALGIPTPASAAILATAHGIERGELAPSPDLVGSTRRSAGVG